MCVYLVYILTSLYMIATLTYKIVNVVLLALLEYTRWKQILDFFSVCYRYTMSYKCKKWLYYELLWIGYHTYFRIFFIYILINSYKGFRKTIVQQ